MKCARCPQLAVQGKKLCLNCASKNAIRARMHRASCKQKSACRDCGLPSDSGKNRCKICCRKQIENQDPDKNRKASLKWRNSNVEKARSAYSRWARENPEKVAARNAKRRAMRILADGFYTAEEILNKAQCFEYSCFYCEGPYEQDDHFYPLSKSLNNTIDNIVPSCRDCNCSKCDRDPFEWMEQRLAAGKKLSCWAIEALKNRARG